MKNIIKVLVILILLLFGITIRGVAAELTPSSVTIGKDGFKFLYTSNNNSSNIFLKKYGMLPGDSVNGSFTIFNQLKEPFKVYFKAERLGEKEEVDLRRVIHITIKEGDKYIFNDTLMKEDEMAKSIYLGILNPKEKKVFDVKATLDPKATDNKYKNKKVEDQWTFTAIGTEDNKVISSNSNKPNGNSILNNYDKPNNQSKYLQNIINDVKGILPKTGYGRVSLLVISFIFIFTGISFLISKKRKIKDTMS